MLVEGLQPVTLTLLWPCGRVCCSQQLMEGLLIEGVSVAHGRSQEGFPRQVMVPKKCLCFFL